jgi:hypothetical protein
MERPWGAQVQERVDRVLEQVREQIQLRTPFGMGRDFFLVLFQFYFVVCAVKQYA